MEQSLTGFSNGARISGLYCHQGDVTVNDIITATVRKMADDPGDATVKPYRKATFTFPTNTASVTNLVVDVDGTNVLTVAGPAATTTYTVDCELWTDLLDTATVKVTYFIDGIVGFTTVYSRLSVPQSAAIIAGDFDIDVTHTQMDNASVLRQAVVIVG